MAAIEMRCEGCGTQLQVEAGVRFAACANCGRQMEVPGEAGPMPMKWKVLIGLGCIAVAFVLTYVSSAWVRGHVRGLWWQWFGDAPFVCDGNEVVTITGKTFEHGGGAVGAAGACEVTLIDCHFKGAQPIGLIGGPSLVMEGGSIEATEKAITSRGTPKKIVLRDVTITSQGDGVVLYGRELETEIHGGSIQAAKVGLASTYGAQTRVYGTRIEGGELALKVFQGGKLWLDEAVSIKGESVCGSTSAIEGPGAPAEIGRY